jgi:hypothetical protein
MHFEVGSVHEDFHLLPDRLSGVQRKPLRGSLETMGGAVMDVGVFVIVVGDG